MEAAVVSVSRDPLHNFCKKVTDSITLIAGLGVEGDAHLGEHVQHITFVLRNPTAPNRRQVLLIHSELFEELRAEGFHVAASDLGENILTRGLDLLGLPLGARLYIGNAAIIEITGVRKPCGQIDTFQNGLLAAVCYKDGNGKLVEKAGVFGNIVVGGTVFPGDSIRTEMPAGEWQPLPRLGY